MVTNDLLNEIDSLGLMTGIFGPNKVGEYTEGYQSGDHAHYGKIIPGEKLTDDNNNCSCKCDEKLTKEAGHSVYPKLIFFCR